VADLPAFLVAVDEVDFAAALFVALAGVFGAAALGISPSVVLTGQILNIGHFWQPTAMAMGQMVMANPREMRSK
jgi:hypothetical protein